jgi:C4-dicarboxylate-specific signal transduction histidine kinase
MSKADLKNELAKEYEEVARRYIQSRSEDDLYQASLLGRKLLKEDLGPTEIIQLHFNTEDAILKDKEVESLKAMVDPLRDVLLEVMMVYGQSHQQVQDILVELQQRYADLDLTKQELEKSRDELRETTAQLVQDGKMKALGELAAGLTHEITQPMNAMKIICEDVLRDIRKDRLDMSSLEDSLNETIQQIMRMADIINHMGIFARKTVATRQERIDINLPLEGVFSLIGQELVLCGIQLTKELTRELHVIGNRVRLEQVFMNLIANARDAVANNEDSKGKSILIRTSQQQGEGDDSAFVVFQIRDNGKGIAKELQEKVFEPFFTNKEAGKGTGLGLSVTKQIIDEHGGRIEVDSKEGEETTFTVILPIAFI